MNIVILKIILAVVKIIKKKQLHDWEKISKYFDGTPVV